MTYDFGRYEAGEITQEELMNSVLETVSTEHPNVLRVMHALEGESDRGVALAGVAFVDEILKNLLNTYFKFGVKRFGAVRDEETVVKSANELLSLKDLGGFYTKLNLAYVLGLLGQKTFHNLKVAGNIRNDFAHHLDVSDFNNELIKQKVKRFKGPLEAVGSSDPNETNKLLFVAALGGALTLVVGLTTMLEKGIPIHKMIIFEDDV